MGVIAQSAPVGLFIVNGEGQIVFANQEAERSFGYLPGELAGKPVAVLIPTRMAVRHREHMKAFLIEGQPRRMADNRVLPAARKDGGEIHVEVGLGPFRDRGKRMVVVTVVDVTPL